MSTFAARWTAASCPGRASRRRSGRRYRRGPPVRAARRAALQHGDRVAAGDQRVGHGPAEHPVAPVTRTLTAAPAAGLPAPVPPTRPRGSVDLGGVPDVDRQRVGQQHRGHVTPGRRTHGAVSAGGASSRPPARRSRPRPPAGSRRPDTDDGGRPRPGPAARTRCSIPTGVTGPAVAIDVHQPALDPEPALRRRGGRHRRCGASRGARRWRARSPTAGRSGPSGARRRRRSRRSRPASSVSSPVGGADVRRAR